MYTYTVVIHNTMNSSPHCPHLWKMYSSEVIMVFYYIIMLLSPFFYILDHVK